MSCIGSRRITYADGGAQSFVYDATGNRTSETRDGLVKTYAYDAADQLTNAGDGVRAYDANGALTKVGSHLGLTWDVRGKLTQVTTTPANTAPTANAGTNRTSHVNRLAILDGSGSTDPEGEPLTYAWTEDPTNPQTGILHGAASPKPGFTPTTAGTYRFSLTVSDGRATSAGSTVTFTVLAGAAPNQTLSSVSASGDSGYVASSNPTGKTFGSDLRTGKSSTTEFRGAAQFVLPATPWDTTLSGATLDLMGRTNVSNTAGDSWTVDLLPTSADANWTSTSWNGIGTLTADSTLTPSLDGLNQVVANSLDSWTFGSGDLAVLISRLAGSGKLSIRTKGNGASTSSQVYWWGGYATTASNRPKLTLTFSPNAQYDHAPIARAGLDQTVAAGTVTLDGSGSYDYEDASVTHGWTQLGGATVSLSSTSAAAPTFTAAPGVYRFRDTVTDSASQTAADEVVVTVLPQAVPATTTYTYDGDGDRVSQTAGGVTTSYVVNSVPKNAQVLLETTGASTTYYVYGQDLLYSVKADGMHAHHTDSLGSTIAVTDGTGAVEQTMDYDVFGRMRGMTGTNGTTYTFTGEENDATALVYLRARYYDPAAGRLLSRDPFPMDALDTQTVNRYAYVKNNPTNYVDPSGEFAFLAALAAPEAITAIAAVGAGVVAAMPYIKATGQATMTLISAQVNAHLAGVSGSSSHDDSARAGQSGKSPKIPRTPGDLLAKIGFAASSHLIQRLAERDISESQVATVLKYGSRLLDSRYTDVEVRIYNGLNVWFNFVTNTVISARYGEPSKWWTPF